MAVNARRFVKQNAVLDEMLTTVGHCLILDASPRETNEGVMWQGMHSGAGPFSVVGSCNAIEGSLDVQLSKFCIFHAGNFYVFQENLDDMSLQRDLF